MKRKQRLISLAAAIALASFVATTHSISPASDLEAVVTGAFKPETFYGKNVTFLNNNNDVDKLWWARHILDFNLDLGYGKKTYEKEVAHMRFTIRNKGVWGNPNNIAQTTTGFVKDVNSIVGGHRHYIPRQIFWLREAWLKFEVEPALGLGTTNKHSFTIGAFPFQLGRGISLGDAYAVGPLLLGFYTDFDVDQYATGAKLSGDFLPDVLTYDLYTAILQNKCASTADTGELIYGQAFGRANCQQRGFGHLNFLVAGRVEWTVFDQKDLGSLTVQPYALYNNDPEQTVQFLADASSKLGTVGLNVEYEGERFATGFDYAQNFGQQMVMGWDRNAVARKNLDGYIVEYNSNVSYDSPKGENVLFVKGSDAQKIIDRSRDDEVLGDGAQKEAQNSGLIGNVNGRSLYNSPTRYRNAYNNTYHGWMIVGDASVWAFKKDLQFSVAAGAASGDENPNTETKDGTYDGFLGLQEIYSGSRVKSVFLMGGAGKAKRPLAFPTSAQAPSRFASVVSGFTNTVFTGASCNWKPADVKKKFNVHPNVLAYWQQKPTKAFDLLTRQNSTHDARTFLGIEANTFFNYHILKDLRFFVVGSAFFPGTYYSDIRGKPLDAAQLLVLERANISGDSTDVIPNLGTDVAYTFNIGLDYKF